MKILIGAPAYPPEVGGIQTLSARLAGALAKRGHEVSVLARSRGPDPRIDAETAPARVTRVAWKPLLWPAFLARFLADRPHALLLTHRADFLRPALMLRRLGGCPLAVVVHGNEVYGSPRRAELLAALAEADAVIGVSRYARERLIGLGLPAAKTFAIPNGVHVEGFDPPEAGEAVRRRLGLAGKRVILSVGRLSRVKGFDSVIRALPRVAERFPDAVYLLVGGGPEEASLRGLAAGLGVAERVVFAGEVPHGEMGRGAHAYYQACDLFAMPSREDRAEGAAEAFGIAYLEAGACGKPVVGGLSGGVREAVGEGESGLLADPERPEAVAEAILRLLSSPELARTLGEGGRRRAEARLWSRVAVDYEAVLGGIASR
ncbi:MAG: glycosyltransferase family 4 protein [Candidatus Tectomicrobia bacterium]|nr:glycosyltransferase family 4 protein [Candidatus Tectomicrobia bacterium]